MRRAFLGIIAAIILAPLCFYFGYKLLYPTLCVPKTLSELMTYWNRLSWWNDRAVLFRSGRAGRAVQVEVTA
jgi:hypothetical protein